MKVRIRTRSLVGLGAVILVLVGAGAFLLGRSSKGTPFIVGPGIAALGSLNGVGTAYFGDQSLHRAPRGFAYFVSSNISWTDATGAVHEGSGGDHPSCLPYGHAEHVVEMEAVKYPVPEGGHTGTILWVRC